MATIYGANSVSGFDVPNSLRFNDGSSDYLNFTPSSNGSRRIFTISFWFKQTNSGATRALFSTGNYSGGDGYLQINLSSSGRLTVDDYDQSGNSYNLRWTTPSTILFRDPAAWYHFVLAVDSTQGTQSNRAKVYINGVDISSSFTQTTSTAQNDDFHVNTSSQLQQIGRSQNNNNYYDGYLAEFVMIDGSALAPTSFGEFDEDSPTIWKPIKVSELTFGTNGFYLQFKETGTSQNSSGLGADTSGNDHHYAVNNLAATDQTTDTCTNNYATMNPLTIVAGASLTLSEGNLDLNGNATDAGAKATFGVSSGKWYWEIKTVLASSGSDRILVATENVRQITSATDPNSQGIWGIQSRSGSGATLNSFTNGTFSNGNSGSTGFNDNTIIGVALDVDNGKLYFHKDGTYTDLSGNTGNPANGTNPTFTGLPTDGTFLFPYVENRTSSGSPSSQVNFGGAPPFAISSGNSDANGYGNFEYTVPSGYYALNSKNLAEYG